MVAMSDVLPEVSASFQVGPKGRAVIPVGVRRLAGIGEGAQLYAVVLGEGRVLIETLDAVRQRVWDGAGQQDALPAAADDVRQARLEDVAVSDEAAARRSATGDSESDARGAALLAELGL